VSVPVRDVGVEVLPQPALSDDQAFRCRRITRGSML
jgi:hypothetical protein